MKVSIRGKTYQRWMDVTHHDCLHNPDTVDPDEWALDEKIVNAETRRYGRHGFRATMDLTEDEAATLAEYCLLVGDQWDTFDPELQPEYRAIYEDGKKIAALLNG